MALSKFNQLTGLTTTCCLLVQALAGLKSKSGKRKGKQTDALSALLTVVESPSTPSFIAAAILHALSTIDSMVRLAALYE